MSNQNKNNIERDRSVYLDRMDEISNEELDEFFGFPKDEEKAVKVPGVGVFTPFSHSRTPDDFPTFIDKTAEAQKRRRLRAIEKAIERQNNNEDDK